MFSTLDLKSGYWQIPASLRDGSKTVLVCYAGLYELNSFKTALSVHTCFCGRNILLNVLFMTSYNTSYLGCQPVAAK